MAKSQWSKLDYFLPMSLVKEENSLRDLKGGKVAINNGATKVLDGFDYDGSTSSIDSNYNPFTDSVNYTFEDAQIDVFIKETTNSGNSMLFGSSDSGIANGTYLRDNSDNNNIRASINGTQRNFTVDIGDLNTLATINFDASGKIQYIEDGVLKQSLTFTKTDINDSTFIIGAGIDTGVIQQYVIGVLSLFSIGSEKTVNQVAKSDIYKKFLTDLGITL